MKKNIFDKFQGWIVLSVEKFEKREDKDVLRKIPFWIVFFFPYGIYLLLFKTKINKFIKIMFVVITILLTIVGFDVAMYPNRVYNNTCKDYYSKFVSEHKELNLKEPLYASKVSNFKVDNQLYFGFDIYDSTDMYYGIFKINDFHKDYELISLYDIDYEFKNIYCSEDFSLVKDVHPVILSFILSAQDNFDLSSILKETDVNDGDVFNNLITQDIKIKNKSYSFDFNDFDVIKIIEKDTNKILFEDSTHESLSYYSPQIVKNILQKNFGSTYEILGYNYYNNAHYYNVEVAGEFYTAKYLPGVNVDLLLIDDLNEFKENFIHLVRKY